MSDISTHQEAAESGLSSHSLLASSLPLLMHKITMEKWMHEVTSAIVAMQHEPGEKRNVALCEALHAAIKWIPSPANKQDCDQ